MRIKPILKYNGLTIIMSSPSRFDFKCGKLLSGESLKTAGFWFKERVLLEAGIDWKECDIVTLDYLKELLPNTKAVLCLGLRAQNSILKTNNTLGEQRGSPVELSLLGHKKLYGLSSIAPQECYDREDYEKSTSEEDEADNVTKRANFRFWLLHDTKKIARIMKQGLQYDESEIIITNDAVSILNKHEGPLFLDIETSWKVDNSIRCFAFCGMEGPVYVAPLMNYKDEPCHDFFRILLTLCLVIRKSPIVVTHNGAAFDHLILCWRYKMPMFNRNMYDTMIAQHRIYQLIEKSLGHCISMWTDDPYHKGEGLFEPHSYEDDHQLFFYCGKDVRGLRAVYKAQRDYIEKDAGLKDSVDIGQQAANAYFEGMLAGHPIDDEKRKSLYKELKNKCDLFIRVSELLIGKDLKSTLSDTKKPSPVISSKNQLAYYLHSYKGIKPIAITTAGSPMLGKVEIYKLINRKVDDPIFKMILPFRVAQKAAGDLDIGQWYRNYKDYEANRLDTV